MASSDFDGTVTSGGGSGVSRRDAIKKGAVAGGVLWATPVIQMIGINPMSVAHASHGGPHDCLCTGTNSFDLRAVLTGSVAGTVGPIRSYPTNTGCLANLTVTAPGKTDPFATALADCVGGSQSGGSAGCSSFVELTNLAVDLSKIDPLLNIQLNASVVRAEASCTCGGGCTTRVCITQVAGAAIVSVAGAPLGSLGTGVAVCDSAVVLNVNIPGTLVAPAVTGTVSLMSETTNPCRATVAEINVSHGALLNIPAQTVNLVIARATAVCTQT